MPGKTDIFEQAFVYDITDGERPVRFGFSPEEREYLKKERTSEEIMNFIREKHLDLAVMNAQFNNDIGFSFFRADGRIVRNEDGFAFRTTPDAEGGMEFQLGGFGEKEWGEYLENRDRTYFMVVAVEEEGGQRASVLMSVNPEKENGNQEVLLEAVTETFLKEAGVNTFHRLGKIINKGQKLRNEYNQATGAYPIVQELLSQRRGNMEWLSEYIRKKTADR